MRRSLFLFAIAPFLGGCLGPAPWADWESGTATSNHATGGAPWAGWEQSGGQPGTGYAQSQSPVSADTSSGGGSPYAMSDKVTYGARPSIEVAAAEPIAGAPPQTRPLGAAEGMGGPYAPLNSDPKPLAATPSQPLKLHNGEPLRTLPLVMSGVGTRAP